MVSDNRFDELECLVGNAGLYAKEHQKNLSVTRKSDGSPVTDADIEIGRAIISGIRKLFPDASIISEEEESISDKGEYTFVLDPIDGTDAYSQGMPSFAVSLGVLDSNHNPIAAYISAPRFGIGEESMFVRMDPGSRPLLNGKPIEVPDNRDYVTQITAPSKIYRHFDLSAFEGKTRSLGSTIIHILSPVLYRNISASIILPCYIWDIAAAHAVIKSLSMDAVYGDGEPLVYDLDLLSRRKFRSALFVGTEKAREFVISHVREI